MHANPAEIERVRHSPRFPLTKQGRLAQLGEHLPYKQGVIGSSPIVPTKTKTI